jgi:D-aspartate ligase
MTATGHWPHVVVMDPWTAGLAVARRMTRAGAEVTMVALPGHHWETYSRRVHRVIASYGPGGANWIATLEQVAARSEQVVVLPATDHASELLIAAAARLPENVRAFERDGHGHRALMDKATADDIARRAGVKVPWTRVISTHQDLEPALADVPWPCVVKPVLSHEWRLRYGEQRAFLTERADDVVALVTRPLADGVPMLLSQYVPGGDDAVEEAIVVRLADGSYPVAFGCHKLRQFPRGFGSTGLGVSGALPETMEIARRVLDEAGFVGVAGVETKRDERTGERWFLEVNVRLPAQWGLGDASGVQATRRLVLAMTGGQLGPQPPLREGVRFVSPSSDIDACREILREAVWWARPALAVKLFGPYVGAGEVGLLDVRDPRPGLVWLTELAGRRVRWRGTRRRD